MAARGRRLTRRAGRAAAPAAVSTDASLLNFKKISIKIIDAEIFAAYRRKKRARMTGMKPAAGAPGDKQ
jgi:hypothetical protein